MAPPTNTPDAPPQDGRTARTERTNDAVVEALLSLIEEGDLRPSAPRIADRAGVSLRTVFHHFDDLEALFATAADRQIRRILTVVHPVSSTGPLDERIASFVAERARLHEAITPVRRAALLSEPFSPELRARLTWARNRDHDDVARVFAPELQRHNGTQRRDLFEALSAAAGWSSWESLRAHRQLTAAHARRVIKRTITALLKEDS